MNFKPVAEINELLEKIAEQCGVEIVETEYAEKSNSLTVYLEKEDGVDLDTCEKFHNAIMEPLDDLDPSYGQPYTLNVASAGLDRPFKTPRDFERNLGKEVEIKLYAPLKGKKFLQGELQLFDENTVTVNLNGDPVKIPRNKIAKINKAIIFE